ncbi:MAG: flap endonuclease-1 [Nanoarchaeota archaeon]|nr:flap endonuclease-1 [Nanoarchaeota archaeon]MBU0977592.1 flap endonuclease-1 [Nanoarchaeota archaeon]
MGLQIGELISRREITFEELKDKVVAVDAYNAIYQFLSSIRQPDGTPLMDNKKRITSHLSGLFYRNVALLSEGIKLVYVFDGEYNILKNRTHEIRQEAKIMSADKYEKAKEEEDVEAMGRYARGFVKLEPRMVEESKELLEAMGIEVVQAPGEGEMQAAHLVKDGEAFAVASQDYDALVVGGRKLIQNLTLARKRKTVSGYVEIRPEVIEYERVLNELGIDADQFICLAILVGTDFNPGGIRGIGPKKALALVKQRKYPVEIFRDVEHQLEFNWQDVFEIFKRPNVHDFKIKFPKLNEDKIISILVGEHDFSEERVVKNLDKLHRLKRAGEQTKLF